MAIFLLWLVVVAISATVKRGNDQDFSEGSSGEPELRHLGGIAKFYLIEVSDSDANHRVSKDENINKQFFMPWPYWD